MSEATQAVQPPGWEQQKSLEYDAFLSYTHRDRPVVSGIQKGLHRIGRRLGQLRALRVFRDDTDLTASPDLWGRIVDALDRSRFLIVTLSPQAAQSQWVNQEVGYWLQQRGRDQLMLVVAAGQLQWDPAGQRFDPDVSDAAPPVLTEPGSLPAEPLFIDVSEDAPWDYRAPVFREKVTALAAPIHGVPKDQLASDDLREQRRFRRLRAAAIAGLAVLTVIAVIAAIVAVVQRGQAIRERDQAIAQRLDSEADGMLAGKAAGGDARAFQQVLAARALAAQPDDATLLHALDARTNTIKIIDTGARVLTVAVSPDGHRLVSGGTDTTVRLWNADTGHPIGAPLTGHTAAVHGVAFSPDGHRLATASLDTTVRLWDAHSGQPLGAPLTGHTQSVNSVAFSPDGHRLATAGADQTVRLWDAITGAALGPPRTGHTDSVFTVAFSPDGRRLVTASRDATIRIWDADQPLTGHTDGVASVAFSPDGHRLVSGSEDKTVRVIATATRLAALSELADQTPGRCAEVLSRSLPRAQVPSEFALSPARRLAGCQTLAGWGSVRRDDDVSRVGSSDSIPDSPSGHLDPLPDTESCCETDRCFLYNSWEAVLRHSTWNPPAVTTPAVRSAARSCADPGAWPGEVPPGALRGPDSPGVQHVSPCNGPRTEKPPLTPVGAPCLR
jgi:MTH538 TIR-like domain (DUF1863)/WD domain, G-beta repeat